MMLGLLPKDDRDSDLYQLYDADVTAPEKLALYNTLVSDDNIHDIEQRIKEVCFKILDDNTQYSTTISIAGDIATRT